MPLVNPDPEHRPSNEEDEQDNIDARTAARLKQAKQGTESIFHTIGRGFRAVAGFRMYVHVPPAIGEALHESWSGQKKNQPVARVKPIPSFAKRGGMGTGFNGWLKSSKKKR